MSLPNQLTVLRIILTPVFVFLLFCDTTYMHWLSFAVFAIASLTDWYDGYIARKFGVVTKWGKFLDPLADKILVSAGFISFCVIGYFAWWMVIVIIIRDVIITILRSYAIYRGESIAASAFAKVKTFSQIVLLYFVFLYYLFTEGGIIKEYEWIFNRHSAVHFINIVMFFITVITLASAIQYIFDNRSCITDMKRDVLKIFLPSKT
ncbi:CDP-diacylglycerol--glycerol-3-phosphate 3-phosphatidyltransferase [bacterium]|nr:CDP-diacylglycerol--glycerol-3-phosphate 3-phosphatidyltransferase [bacterium]